MPSCFKRDDLTVNHGVIRQVGERFHHYGKAASKVLLIAAPELNSAATLVADLTEAVTF
jgi:hypothetical protein